MYPEKIKKRAAAKELVKEAEALAKRRVNENEKWEENDFKRDFLRILGEIAEILKKQRNETAYI
ncbi:MAG: hypothetical protein MUF15_22440 [Acidobacteria bacterium]|jgi:hypothetical protein|nr:hypothetical protein [Acidobacteriota bacterium]